MILQDILYGVAIGSLVGKTASTVESITFDSRAIGRNTMFVAIKGTQADGHHYIGKAIGAGAKVIICEVLPEELQEDITFVQVENSSIALGIISSNFYGNPSTQIKLIGVTGTNGKTTIATLLFQLFRQLGFNVGLISTVQNQINEEVVPATHTTPNPIALNELLQKMVDAGCMYCFMEVSSHAVAQHRISGLVFTGGVFSNITHDHLDFHLTFDNYLKAKKGFFDSLPKSAFALTNVDDKNGSVMLQNTKANKKTYALKQMADFNAKILENKFSGLNLTIDHIDVYFKMVGSFNAYNLLAAYATAILLDQDKLQVLTVLSSLTGAEGRFDYTVSKQGIIGIVDYAHTPDAVQNVLSTIANIRKGN
ncbi:MAG: UDP-N-acetylmuramoyl-L-alanyl-D-glutamate--2,6-diaminopimelate ligase, partial [Bacteroidia bacterium]